MNTLEKILKEMDKKRESLIDKSDDEPELCDVEDWYDEGVDSGKIKAYCDAADIVRSHMDEITKDDWIPVSERLPKDGTYLCTLDGELCGIDEPFTGMCGIEKGKWDEEGYVIAWQPLPEPYKGGDEK